jgi:hypothetical protein
VVETWWCPVSSDGKRPDTDLEGAGGIGLGRDPPAVGRGVGVTGVLEQYDRLGRVVLEPAQRHPVRGMAAEDETAPGRSDELGRPQLGVLGPELGLG